MVAGGIYSRNKSKKTAILALICGALVQTAAMVLMNMIFTPLFMGAPLETVLAMMVPAIIPFNLLKAGINCTVTFLLYKSISHQTLSTENAVFCNKVFQLFIVISDGNAYNRMKSKTALTADNQKENEKEAAYVPEKNRSCHFWRPILRA